jgi:hypothetical protein
MSRFRFSALLALSVAVVAVIVLRRDKGRAEFSVPVPAAPAEPVAAAVPEETPVEVPSVEVPSVEEPSVEEPSVEEPSVEEPCVEEPYVEEAPVAETPSEAPVEAPAPRVEIPPTPVQLYPETDGVSGADPVPGYWGVPSTPPADWSDSSSFGDRRSA